MVRGLVIAAAAIVPLLLYVFVFSQMGEADVLLLFTLILFALLALFVVSEVRELRFYSRNGWDFTVDSNKNLVQTYKGDSTDDGDRDSNRARVLFGVPLFIVVTFLFFIVLLSAYISESA